MQGRLASRRRPAHAGCVATARAARRGRAPTVRARAQQQPERRMVRLTVAGPPDGQPPRVIEVDDPLSSPAELVCASDSTVHLKTAGITKSEAREQAAIIQAQREEISTLRAALAETQDVMFRGKASFNDVVQSKDSQIAQLYELAASGVRERAKLRQEVTDVQQELQGTKRQLHSFMASLMQLKNSMASAGDGDVDHALELLQSSSFSQSLAGAAGTLGATSAPLSADEEVFLQLQQMQALSETLVQDMRQDEALLDQGLEPRSRSTSPGAEASASFDFDSLDSADLQPSSTGAPSSSSSSSSGRSAGGYDQREAGAASPSQWRMPGGGPGAGGRAGGGSGNGTGWNGSGGSGGSYHSSWRT